MIPDIEIKHYYNKYLKDANNDIIKFQKDYETANNLKLDARKSISSRAEFIADKFNIKLNDYKKEWILLQYDNKEELLNIIKHKIANNGTDGNNITLLWIMKYCQLLKKCNHLLKSVELAKKRASLKFIDYRKYVAKFYQYGVHKCCLEGYAYRYGYGIGELAINRWVFEKGKGKTKLIDYAATREAKAKILAEGKTPYDKRVAEIYKLRGIKYEAVPYVVRFERNYFYDITITNNQYVARQNLEFDNTEYIHRDLRGNSHKELAEKYNNKESVLNLKCDLKTKLGIYNILDKTAYLKYIRNVEQCKYKRGAHNSKNRQRF